jgi:TonB family protein
MTAYRSYFSILILCVNVFSCSSSTTSQIFEGQVIRQKDCTPVKNIQIPDTKIELLSFLNWNPSEATKPPEIIGGVDSLISNIHYPAIARNMGYGGSVLCEFTITSEGKVSNFKILKPIGAGCDEMVQDGIKKTKYIPAQKNGKRIDQLMRASIKFIIIKKKP